MQEVGHSVFAGVCRRVLTNSYIITKQLSQYFALELPVMGGKEDGLAVYVLVFGHVLM